VFDSEELYEVKVTLSLTSWSKPHQFPIERKPSHRNARF